MGWFWVGGNCGYNARRIVTISLTQKKRSGDFVSVGQETPGRRTWAYARTPAGLAPLGALVTVVLLLFAWWQLSRWYQAGLLADVRARTADETYLRANALSLALNERFAALHRLNAFVHAGASDDELNSHFQIFSAGLYDDSMGVRGLAVAPDGIVRYVYPPENSTGVIDYQPLKDDRAEVRDDALMAVDTGDIVVSSPVELFQGGTGIIAQQAVYRDGQFWGLVGVALELPPLLADAGLEGTHQTDFALRENGGQVFYGEQSVFDDDPIIRRMKLPEGAWELGAVPAGGWTSAIRERLLVFQGGGLLAVFLVTGLVFLSVNRQAVLAATVQQRTEEIRTINQQLEQLVAERTGELATLCEITTVASASLDLDHVMRESLTRIVAMLDCEMATIHLLDETETHLHLAAWQGTLEGIVPGIETLPLDGGLAGRVVGHDGPLVVPATESGLAAVPAADSLLAGHAYLGAPMRTKGKVVGVLSILEPAGYEFSAEEVALLASIADQVAVAVDNANLYKQAEALAVAEERQRLAREIHDTLAQGFTGVNILLEAVESALEIHQPATALERLGRARKLANQSLAEARRSVWALRSASLADKKLADAMRDSARGLTAGAGLNVVVEAPDDVPRFPHELENDLLRVTQEAVMNVVKHAQARNLTIQLNHQDNWIELRVDDDGRGFLVETAEAAEDGGGFGLTAMRERIARHGGTLQISSRPGRGTRVVARVELQQKGA